MNYQIENWFTEVETLDYSDYWNNEAQDMNKIWWVLGGDFSKMETYLESISAISQLEECVQAAKNIFGKSLQGVGADLAAGNLWATPHLLRLGAEKVISVEYSRHRLLKLGVAVLEHYGVSTQQALLALGDFHQLKLPDSSLDFVFMSQAFHHSETPRKLLDEIYRALKPTGIVIITGEHITKPGVLKGLLQPIKFFAARFLPLSIQHKIFNKPMFNNAELILGRTSDFIDKDPVLGDHYFTDAQYKRLFQQHGFEFICLRKPQWKSQAFVLTPKKGF
jgi:SAM-dependent methyltransferase